MYNLFVSGDKQEWAGEPFILELSRCVREYTDNELTEKYGDFTKEQVDSIRRFPCIFAYEAYHNKDPKFEIVRQITKKQGKVKVDYDLVILDKFITHSDISEMLFDLDISDWEMNRTHWAIKNVKLGKELTVKNVKLPRWATHEAKAVDITTHLFDVAFSFPGEVRPYVNSIAAELEKEVGPNSYFYDNNYKAQLARPAVDTLLQEIYCERSRLVVVFLCQKYQEKEWCGIEFRAIRDILKSREHKKVMYVKMDEGKVEGVFSTDGYIDRRSHTPEEVATFIRERIELLR